MKVKTTQINRKRIIWLLEQDLDVKITALQHHLDISRMLVNDILEDEVNHHTGYWYSHDKPHNGRYSRWGTNPGSIKLGDRRIRLAVPRIYDNESGSNKQDHYRKRINQAYRSDDYNEARKLIKEIIKDLRIDNLSASRSMEEGQTDRCLRE